MKKTILAACIVVASFHLNAQSKNALLDQSFWKTSPSLSSVKELVQQGNNPSESNFMAFDPTTMAINNGAPAEVILFLAAQEGNGVKKRTHDGRTYLFWAATKGNLPVMEYLLRQGADPNLEDSHGMTPLSFAAATGQSDLHVYQLLIDNGADYKKTYQNGASLLLLAVQNDKELALTDYLISKGLQLKAKDDKGRTAFDYAAQTGNLENMKLLLKRGVPFTSNALIMASEGSRRSSNKLEVYEYLTGLGIKPDVTGTNRENVLHNIVRKPNQEDIIDYFIKKGVDVNQADKDGNTPFLNACAFNQPASILEVLLGRVKNINQTNLKGQSALALAVQGNTEAAVSLLIRKGADVQTKDRDGNTLTYYWLASYPAGGKGRPKTPEETEKALNNFTKKRQILQEKGINFAAPQSEGNTLYHLAVARQDLNLLKEISTLDININALNKEGMTALQKAALIAKDDQLLQFLLAHGADKKVATEMGETAYDLAKDNEYLSKNNISIDFLK